MFGAVTSRRLMFGGCLSGSLAFKYRPTLQPGTIQSGRPNYVLGK